MEERHTSGRNSLIYFPHRFQIIFPDSENMLLKRNHADQSSLDYLPFGLNHSIIAIVTSLYIVWKVPVPLHCKHLDLEYYKYYTATLR